MSPPPSIKSICYKVGNSTQKVCFSLCNQVLILVFLEHLGHGLLGDLEEGMALTVVLFPYLKWGVNPQS